MPETWRWMARELTNHIQQWAWCLDGEAQRRLLHAVTHMYAYALQKPQGEQ